MLKSITFEVVGESQMACENCEERVEHALKSLEGVGRVRANARNQRVEVLFDTNKLDGDAIAARIAQTGYETRVAPPS